MEAAVWAHDQIPGFDLFSGHAAVMLAVDSASGRILDANASAAAFYGYSREALRGMTIYDINMYEPADVNLEMERASLEERRYFIFPHRLASGEVRTVEVYSSPVYVPSLGAQVLVSVVHDVHDRVLQAPDVEEYRSRLTALVERRAGELYAARAASIGVAALSVAFLIAAVFFIVLFWTQRKNAAALRGALEEKSYLLKELQHRVKNTLNTVAAMVEIEGGRHAGGPVAAAMGALYHRVEALALLYQRLYEGNRDTDIEAVSYLQGLVTTLRASFKDSYGDVLFQSSVNELFLDAKRASNVGLIANELVTNALKYGRPKLGENGAVAVAVLLDRTEDGVVLSVRNYGKGLPEEFSVDSGEGFGLLVSREFAKQMKGSLFVREDRADESVTFGVAFPL